MNAIEKALLSRAEARSLTDEVKNDAERLWRKLVELYEGGAHEVLGYKSWGAYFKAEFGQSHRQAYTLLDAGRVMRELGAVQHAALPGNARQAVELAPLKNDPHALHEAWAEVIELNPEPTAADVREIVHQKLPKSNKTLMNEGAARRRLYDALNSIRGYCSALEDFNVPRALAGASPDDIAAWERLASESSVVLNRLKRAVREAE